MQNQRSEWANAEIKISYKPAKQQITVSNSQTAHAVFKEIWDSELISIQEQFYVLFLDQKNQLLCWRLLATGTISSCPVDRKLLAAITCKTMAQHIVLAHNHPTGIVKPSPEDKQMTWAIQEMLTLFNSKVLDHLIVSADSYFSFADENLLIDSFPPIV